MIARIAPLLDLEPRFDLPTADQLILAKAARKRSLTWSLPSPAPKDAGRSKRSGRVGVT